MRKPADWRKAEAEQWGWWLERHHVKVFLLGLLLVILF